MNTSQSSSFFTTRTNYWLEVVCTVLFFSGLLGYAILTYEYSAIEIIACVAFGVLVWTFIEYAFHCWLFHKSSIRAFRHGHAKHHVDPLGFDALPFFFPSVIFGSVGIILQLIIPFQFAILITAIIVAGYFYYGMVHLAIHHLSFDTYLLNKIKEYHELHHQQPGSYFGVTTSLWDHIFRTR